jgi:hypothetical protein
MVVRPGDFQGVGGSGGERLYCLPERLCSGLEVVRVMSLSQGARSAKEIGLWIEDVPWP